MARDLTAVACAALLVSSLAGCSQGGSSGRSASTSPGGATAAPITSYGSTGAPAGPQVIASGTIRALTYNVAGLPQGISSSNPVTNTPQISPLLNGYELVLVQEDFWYHAELAAQATHPYRSLPLTGYSTLVNDGLNRFSTTPFGQLTRIRWGACHGLTGDGNDCLSSKGFSVARHELHPGVTVDVYNIHADAGSSGGDIRAREDQFEQLARFMAVYSANQPLIVAGDTNLRGSARPDDEQVLLTFLAATGLQDAARTLGAPESIDRLMFRGTSELELRPTSWRAASEFVDASGGALSDHDAIHVDLEWRYVR